MNPDTKTDYDQPVAYDKDGRPLYAHPPAQVVASTIPEQVVHVTRAMEPIDQPLSEEALQRHEASVKRYPALNLSKGEYVIQEVSRHWIGLIAPIAAGAFLAVIICAALVLFPATALAKTMPSSLAMLIGFLLLALVAIGTYIPVWVYRNNRFYLTNESAIQDIQVTLFAHQEQTISLGSVEDVSFHQSGIVESLLGYGTIRLSTVGDEDTYTFPYVTNPREHVAVLNNAVEAFKNGRPVSSS
jgi:uncharacterized membrane protein YdbT with pleckstrin-like domain